jgi:hypothetical protein
MLQCRSEEKRSVNLKKATLAAAVCASVQFVYPNLVLFLSYVYAMATGKLAGIHNLRQVAAMWAVLPRLGLAAFLIVFFREQCGNAQSQTRRLVARIGAALMGVQAALQGALLIVAIAGQTPASFAYYYLWGALTQMALSGVAASALWTALLIVFAREDGPFQGAGTRPLPLILAADLAVAELWFTYSFVPTLRQMWASSTPWVFWVTLLELALGILVCLSLFVFLLSVWRYQARAAEPGAAVPQDVP